MPVDESSALAERDGSRTSAAYAEAIGVQPYPREVALAMMLNYVIGTGCFALPYAFAESGVVLALSILVLGGLVGAVTMSYTLEAMERADGFNHAKGGGAPPDNRLTYDKYDFVRIAELFEGAAGLRFTQACIFLYSFGTLWSYATVFSSSLAAIIHPLAFGASCDALAPHPAGSCSLAYYASLCVFSAVVLALVVRNLSHQAFVQKFLSMYRVVALLVMLLTLGGRLAAGGAAARAGRSIWSTHWSRFGKAFGPCFLSTNCHFNIPDAVQPLDRKSQARAVTFTALWLSIALYVLLGTMGALTFEPVSPLVSLDWAGYTGCGSGWDSCGADGVGGRTVLGHAVRMLVLLFPAVNVASAFPLLGVTMGDNLSASLGGVRPSAARLLSACPPLLLAAVARKLDVIISAAGVVGFSLEITIPCMLYLASGRAFQERLGARPVGTPFSTGPWGGPHIARAVLLASILAMALAAVTIPA